MHHSEFVIGARFYCGGRTWRCTDIGSRTVIAIRLDEVEVVTMRGGQSDPQPRRVLTEDQATREGWFNGPPYAVAETVFDEDSLPACCPALDDSSRLFCNQEAR